MASENGRNSNQSHETTIHYNWGNPSLYLEQPVTKKAMPANWRLCPIHPPDSSTATRLGLHNSLRHHKTSVVLCTRRQETHISVTWQDRDITTDTQDKIYTLPSLTLGQWFKDKRTKISNHCFKKIQSTFFEILQRLVFEGRTDVNTAWWFHMTY